MLTQLHSALDVEPAFAVADTGNRDTAQATGRGRGRGERQTHSSERWAHEQKTQNRESSVDLRQLKVQIVMW